uniref:Retrovirus-related Pol polyprotein from transposon TNT 1-94 n=1 Tax=Tanacetum cinerariifolium TaxID=118510 RepID=A0A699HHY9_TANCI|nr:hypothetical protein [Tanacetum cinerariifolium]
MDKCDSVSTPIRLDADLQGTPIDQMEYHSMIGGLMYLIASRPYIAFATFAVRVIRHDPRSNTSKRLSGSFDHVGCHDDYKTTSRGLQFLGEKLVSWSSKKQDCTALSTAKAEGTTELYFVGIEYQFADLFTKALPKERFEYPVHRIGYKAASSAEESFVKSSEMFENQENVKGYHAVPPSYTGNCIPPKPDLMFIDEQVEGESVDVVSTVSSSAVKTAKSKVESINVKNKGVCSTIETKPVRKNNFSPLIIKDWISNDQSEVEIEPKFKDKNVRPSVKKIKFVKTARGKEEKDIANLKKKVMKLERKRRSRTPGMNLFKIGTSRRRSLGEDDASKQGRNLKQVSIFEESDFDVQAMIDADYELAARLRAEEQRRKPLTKAQKGNKY